MTAQNYFKTLESGLSQLFNKDKSKVFRQCAMNCVKDTVMKEMRRQFQECGCDLYTQQKKYGHTLYLSKNN